QQRVLDFGCGNGRLSKWLVERGAAVDGVDLTPEMVSAAREAVPEASFATIDGTTLPFRDDSFDVILAVYVLQYHVREDRGVARELGRVLRQGGRLLAIEQVTDSDLGRGAPASAYEELFVNVGLRLVDVATIRLGTSPLAGLAGRYPLV